MCHFEVLQQPASCKLVVQVEKPSLLAVSKLNAAAPPCTPVLCTLCICVRARVNAHKDSTSVFDFVLVMEVVEVVVVVAEEGVLSWGVCTCQSVRLSVCTVAKSLSDFQHPSPMPI